MNDRTKLKATLTLAALLVGAGLVFGKRAWDEHRTRTALHAQLVPLLPDAEAHRADYARLLEAAHDFAWKSATIQRRRATTLDVEQYVTCAVSKMVVLAEREERPDLAAKLAAFNRGRTAARQRAEAERQRAWRALAAGGGR